MTLFDLLQVQMIGVTRYTLYWMTVCGVTQVTKR